MSWIIYEDEDIKIKGTSNGYYTIIVPHDNYLNEDESSFDIDNPEYFTTLARAFIKAGVHLKLTLADQELYRINKGIE